MAVPRSFMLGEFSFRAIFGSASRVEGAGGFEDLAAMLGPLFRWGVQCAA
jgi:hypothetical protein